MSSQFLSLEEAAKKLGVTTDQLVAYRSEGKIRGFRDGASWKFPEAELDRLAEDLAADADDYDPYRLASFDDDQAGQDQPAAEGSGVLVDDLDLGSAVGTGSGSRVGSDVNLVADSSGSDVRIVPSETDEDSDFLLKDRREGLVELDSGELQLSPEAPVISHDSEVLDLAIEPKSGSTGPIVRAESDEPAALRSDSGLNFDVDDQDSDDELLGLSEGDDLLGGNLHTATPPTGQGSQAIDGGLSSLELMDDLDVSPSGLSPSGRDQDDHVLGGDLDLLSDAGDSGLISGDSGSMAAAGVGSSVVSAGSGPRGSSLDLDDDDELLITDDEDELVLGGSDLSVAGDSGINLMSPSDSGISLESEPLDLAGSSISALDLGGELGSGIGSRGSASGSMAGEDFQLSPSGIALDAETDSSSQVIEVEDSAAFADPGALGEDPFGGPLEGDDAFAQEAGGFGDEDALGVEDGFGEEPVVAGARGAAPAAWEVPYSLFQVVGLVCIVLVMSLGGMLMSDLVRNMWTYSEPAAPVSGLTDWLIEISPFGS